MIEFDNNIPDFKTYLTRSVLSRSIIVEIDGERIDSSRIVAESLDIKSAICDAETFCLGGCISSRLTLRFMNIDSFISSHGGIDEKEITVSVAQSCAGNLLVPSNSLYPSDSLFPGYPVYSVQKRIFTGRIDSARRKSNRTVVEVTAYDELYRMSKTRIKALLEGVLLYSPSAVDSLFDLMAYVLQMYDSPNNTDYEQNYRVDPGFQYDVSPHQALALDRSLVSKADDNLSVLDVLKAHCELNARFAYIDPYGALKFITLYKRVKTGTNPITYRVEAKPVDEQIGYYSSLTCEDYVTSHIKYASFPCSGGELRATYGITDDKRYWYRSENIITSWIAQMSGTLPIIANYYTADYGNYIFGGLYSYRPFSISTFGEWWLEPGDVISAVLKYYDSEAGEYRQMTVQSFVLERQIKGVANMKVILEAGGNEYIGKDELTYEQLQ